MRFDKEVEPANDNARAEAPPIVRTPRGRPQATYACAAGVILPLRFARRMDGWRAARDSRGPRKIIPRR
jgi:hypothetical protein